MNEDYSIFRKFSTLEQATALKELLSKNGIESELGDNVTTLDITFSGNTLQHQIEVRIKQTDFNITKSYWVVLDE